MRGSSPDPVQASHIVTIEHLKKSVAVLGMELRTELGVSWLADAGTSVKVGAV